jgi:AcrR family transcriptional regulator
MSKAPLFLLQFQEEQGTASMNEQVVPEQRVIPRQQRSLATVDVILEAAAQVLEIAGEAGFNTNAIAERAGVGIGSIYRYFPDKHAILVEMGRREMARVGAQLRNDPRPKPGRVAPDRQAIRTFLRAFGERTRARRVVVLALLGQLSAEELQAAFAQAEAGMASRSAAPLDRIQLFVLSRAMLGAMRAAVLEDADFLLSQQFEDELVLLSRTYASAASGRLSG